MKLSRLLARAVHSLLRKLRGLRAAGRRPAEGAHAAAFTPSGRLILVRLRYAPGWRLPGGGRAPGERLEQAALRELREEIGLRSHGEVESMPASGLVIVRDVRYTPPRWSWEVEAVCEADLDALPRDLSPRAGRWLREIAAQLTHM